MLILSMRMQLLRRYRVFTFLGVLMNALLVYPFDDSVVKLNLAKCIGG